MALVTVTNGALLTMIMASRMACGMAEQRLLPAVLGRVLPDRRTPGVAIASCLLPLSQQEARVWSLAGLLLAGGVARYLLTRLAGRRPSAPEAARRA